MTTPQCTSPEFHLDPRTGILSTRTPAKVANPLGAGTMMQTNALMTDPKGGLWTPQTPLTDVMQQWQGWSGGTPSGGNQPVPAGTQWKAPVSAAAIVNPSHIHDVVFHVKVEWEISFYTYYRSWVELWGQLYWLDPVTGQASGLAPWAGPTGVYVIGSFCPSGRTPATTDAVYWHHVVHKTFEMRIPAGGSVTPSFALQAACVSVPASTSNPEVRKWRASLSCVGALVYPVNVA